MGRVILITGDFQKYDSYGNPIIGETEFVVSHGVDEDTGKIVIVQAEHPRTLGAKFDCEIGEWVL